MLAKLMKYEFKGTARLFLPLYAALIVFAAATRLTNPLRIIEGTDNFSIKVVIPVIGTMLFYALIVGVVIMTLVIMIQRFYKSLLGDEGYLMFTLPVKPWQHIISKLILSVMWTALSFITVIGSVAIIAATKEILNELPEMFRFVKGALGTAGFFTVPVYALLASASWIMMVYSAIALGHLFTRHKLIASFGMYCALYTVYQMLLVIFIAAFGNTIFTALLNTPSPTPFHLNMFILALGVISLILLAANFTITNYILKKKLNLE